MKEKEFVCRNCQGTECVEVVRGYLGNPKVFLKCKKCFTENEKVKF